MGLESGSLNIPADAATIRVAVVHAAFNGSVTDGLLAGALEFLDEVGISEPEVVVVPGSFELPLVAKALAEAGFEAIVALGAVVLGDTDHYEHVAHRASEGLMRASLDTGVPVAFGILTARTEQQALARSAPGPDNSGRKAAEAAIITAMALRKIE